VRPEGAAVGAHRTLVGKVGGSFLGISFKRYTRAALARHPAPEASGARPCRVRHMPPPGLQDLQSRATGGFARACARRCADHADALTMNIIVNYGPSGSIPGPGWAGGRGFMARGLEGLGAVHAAGGAAPACCPSWQVPLPRPLASAAPHKSNPIVFTIDFTGTGRRTTPPRVPFPSAGIRPGQGRPATATKRVRVAPI
jgi:hypothetical protein